MEQKEILELAFKAMDNAYAPYSNYHVGACVACKDGKYFLGANIENASYGLTNCAERTCMFTAYADGVKKEDIVAFCVYSKKESLVSPCGACRQVMMELLPLDCKIYMAYGKDYNIIETSLKELLPFSFTSLNSFF